MAIERQTNITRFKGETSEGNPSRTGGGTLS